VIIAFTMPIGAAILATVVLGERPTWRHVAGLASGMAGLAVLIGPDFVKLEAAPVGALLILFASWCWAGGTIGLKMVDWRMPASVLSGWTILLGGVPIYLGMAVIEELPDLSAYSWTAYGGWAYSTFVAMVWCHFAWYTVVRIFPATVAAIGTLAIPVTGVFSSALLLGEPLGLREIAALTLVLAALGAVLLRSPVRTAAASAPPPAPPPASLPEHRGRDIG
jgi:drug/metabolite transporter (DMT)-like permease